MKYHFLDLIQATVYEGGLLYNSSQDASLRVLELADDKLMYNMGSNLKRTTKDASTIPDLLGKICLLLENTPIAINCTCILRTT